jgi:transposase
MIAAHRMSLSEKKVREHEARLVRAQELKKRGLSNVAIAKRMDVSESTVRRWLKKA